MMAELVAVMFDCNETMFVLAAVMLPTMAPTNCVRSMLPGIVIPLANPSALAGIFYALRLVYFGYLCA